MLEEVKDAYKANDDEAEKIQTVADVVAYIESK